MTAPSKYEFCLGEISALPYLLVLGTSSNCPFSTFCAINPLDMRRALLRTSEAKLITQVVEIAALRSALPDTDFSTVMSHQPKVIDPIHTSTPTCSQEFGGAAQASLLQVQSFSRSSTRRRRMSHVKTVPQHCIQKPAVAADPHNADAARNPVVPNIAELLIDLLVLNILRSFSLRGYTLAFPVMRDS